jgi:urease accessory protein
LITIDSVIGNINKNINLNQKYMEMYHKKVCEVVKISRLESQRVRMRKTSNKGTDIVLILPQGTQLRHGDVIMVTEEKMVIVEMEPENVAVIEIKDNVRNHDIIEIPVRVGHTIGNLHRPVKLEGNKIYFPIQADSELEIFRKLFAPIAEHLEINKTKMVFEPEEGTEIHEH